MARRLLLHVNLLLMMFAGAMLSTAARLRWDPSLYIAARELFPLEYRVAAAALPALALTLLLLAQLPLLGVRVQRAALVLYGCGQAVTLAGWLALGGWAWVRGVRWAGGPDAEELRRTLELREHLLPLLQHLARYHPLPDKITALVQEAEADLPHNLHALLCCAALLAALQLLAAGLALAGACSSTTRDACSLHTGQEVSVEKTPLRARAEVR